MKTDRVLRFSGWAGIAQIALSVLLVVGMMFLFYYISFTISSNLSLGGDYSDKISGFEGVLNNATAVIIIITYLLSVIFFLGFFIIGKKFKNKVLSRTADILIILTILGLILTIILYATGDLVSTQSISTGSFLENSIKNDISSFSVLGGALNFFNGILFWIVAGLIFGIGVGLKISLGIGLIKLKKNNIPLARISGWFEIISVLPMVMILLIFVSSITFVMISSIFSIIGVLFGFVALILETIMFFKVAKRIPYMKS
jgi:hypothetical protein